MATERRVMLIVLGGDDGWRAASKGSPQLMFYIGLLGMEHGSANV